MIIQAGGISSEAGALAARAEKEQERRRRRQGSPASSTDEVDDDDAPLTTGSPPASPDVSPSRAWVGGGILQAPLQRVGEFSCEYGQQLLAGDRSGGEVRLIGIGSSGSFECPDQQGFICRIAK